MELKSKEGNKRLEKEEIFHGVDPADMVNRPSDIVRELRYASLNRTIEESGLNVLMDIPCGYTPRVFDSVEKGMHYIGCDLPEMSDIRDLPFEVKSSVSDGLLKVSVQGRMDTITAPEVLKKFQEAGDNITGIYVDVSKMAYVSAAGLCVFLMMYKSLEDKEKFKMTGINAAIREIIETTGFDCFFISSSV